MVPVAAVVLMAVPELGLVSVTVNPSLASTVVSPETGMVMVWDVTPAPKLTMPFGSASPVKSLAVAGSATEPVTSQLAVLAWFVAPVRVTVKVNAVLSLLPSAFSAEVAAIANKDASSF